MTFFKNALMALAVVAVATSCGTDDPEKEHYVTSFNNHFGYVTENDNYAQSASSVGEITLDIDDENTRATVGIASIEISGTMLRNIMLKDIPCMTDNHGVRTIKTADATKYGAVYPLKGLELTYWPELKAEGKSYHAMFLRLTLDDGRTLTVLPYKANGLGTTTVTTIADASKYESTKMSYDITLRPSFAADGTNNSRAVIEVINPDFDPKMPPLGTMTFQGATDNSYDIALNYVKNGYTLKCPMIVPEIAGAPYPRFSITDLNCVTDLEDNEIEIEFFCAGRYSVDAVVGALYVEMPAAK